MQRNNRRLRGNRERKEGKTEGKSKREIKDGKENRKWLFESSCMDVTWKAREVGRKVGRKEEREWERQRALSLVSGLSVLFRTHPA